jgi:hypothetical protein
MTKRRRKSRARRRLWQRHPAGYIARRLFPSMTEPDFSCSTARLYNYDITLWKRIFSNMDIFCAVDMARFRIFGADPKC